MQSKPSEIWLTPAREAELEKILRERAARYISDNIKGMLSDEAPFFKDKQDKEKIIWPYSDEIVKFAVNLAKEHFQGVTSRGDGTLVWVNPRLTDPLVEALPEIKEYLQVLKPRDIAIDFPKMKQAFSVSEEMKSAFKALNLPVYQTTEEKGPNKEELHYGIIRPLCSAIDQASREVAVRNGLNAHMRDALSPYEPLTQTRMTGILQGYHNDGVKMGMMSVMLTPDEAKKDAADPVTAEKVARSFARNYNFLVNIMDDVTIYNAKNELLVNKRDGIVIDLKADKLVEVLKANGIEPEAKIGQTSEHSTGLSKL